MRVLRAKQVRKHLRFYRLTFGIAPAYRCLLDGSFIHQCLKVKLPIADRLEKLLQEREVRLLVPRAALEELEAFGEPCRAAVDFVQEHCEVLERPAAVGAEAACDGLRRTVGEANAGRFLVCTMDEGLRRDLRRVPGVPLILLNQTSLVLESPSAASLRNVESQERGKQGVTGEAREAIDRIRSAARAAGTASGDGQRVKKRAKGPNPLSVKKRKDATGAGPKRKRVRKRRAAGGEATAADS